MPSGDPDPERGAARSKVFGERAFLQEMTSWIRRRIERELGTGTWYKSAATLAEKKSIIRYYRELRVNSTGKWRKRTQLGLHTREKESCKSG